MTDPQPPATNSGTPGRPHHSGQVVSSNLPRLKWQAMQAWGILIFGGLPCLWVYSLDPPFTYTAPFFLLIVLAVSINGLKRSQDAVILPPIAAGLGLEVDRDKANFLWLLPSQMFPRHDSVTVGALFHCKVEGRVVRLADAKSGSGDGSARSDFYGLVVQVDGLRNLPDFLMVEVAWTKRGWLGMASTIDTEGFSSVQTIPVADRQFDLLRPTGASGAAGLAPVMTILADFGQRLPRGVRLYSAEARSGILNVALHSKAGLLSGGGMFLSAQSVFAGAESAEVLLSIGLELGRALSAAGDAAA